MTIRAKIAASRLNYLLVAIAIILALITIWAIINAGNLNPEAESVNTSLQQINDYPQSYRQANLPQYPGADITHIPPEADHLPTVIYMRTPDPVEQARVFFEQNLTANGWRFEPDLSASATDVVTAVYFKDQHQFNLTIARDQDLGKTNAIISWDN